MSHRATQSPRATPNSLGPVTSVSVGPAGMAVALLPARASHRRSDTGLGGLRASRVGAGVPCDASS